MGSYDVLLWLSLLLVSFVEFSTALCSPPPGSTLVYDSCTIAASLGVQDELRTTVNSENKTIAQLQVHTDFEGQQTSVPYLLKNIELLLAAKPVVAPARAYGGGGDVTQQVTVVEAMTADMRLGANGTLYTFDIGQILALALFNRGADGIYPNVQDPYLGREDLNDNIVGLLEEMDYTLSQINDKLSLNVIDSKSFTGSTLTSHVSSITSLLFDALFMGSYETVISGGTSAYVEYLPLVRMFGMPWSDANVNPAASSCTVSAGMQQPPFPASNFYGLVNHMDDSEPTITLQSTLPNSQLLYESVSRCYSHAFNVSYPDFRIGSRSSSGADATIDIKVLP